MSFIESLDQVTSLRLSRRKFLVRSGAISCAVLFFGPTAMQDEKAYASTSPTVNEQAVSPNIWVTVHSDGMVEVICPALELGQGAHTALPRFVAEELDVDWNNVRVIQASVNDKAYRNPLAWNTQITAGSRTCVGYFDVLRVAGAQARYVLLETAARLWEVNINTLSTDLGFVVHKESGRRIAYQELVADARVPEAFPHFFAANEPPQPPDDYFGEAPPSIVAPKADASNAIPLKPRDKYRLIGANTERRDIVEKVRGTALYAIDIQLPGMLYAMIATGPKFGDTPDEVDAREAMAIPGVTQVVRLPYGIALVGTNLPAVQNARKKLHISWKPDPATTSYNSAEVLTEFAAIARDPKQPSVQAWHTGDTDELSQALEDTRHPSYHAFEMTSELVYQAPLEPQNATISLSEDGKSAQAWVGTQWPTVDLHTAAAILEIPPNQLELFTPYVGGGFGRRLEPGAIIDAAHIAKVVRHPVKVIWTREDDIKRNPFRQALACKIEAVLNSDGSIAATRHRIVADSWLARLFPNYFDLYQKTDPGNWVGGHHAYQVPLQAIEVVTPRRSVPVCYMRGIGVAQIKFAQESLVDQIAAALQVDPIEYRLRQLSSEPRAINVLRTVEKMADWKQRGPSPNEQGRALGVSYTPYSNAHVAMVVEVSVDKKNGNIRLHHIWCAADVGMVAQPDIVASQMEGGITQGLSVALKERVTITAGEVQQSNFHNYPILRMPEVPPIDIRIVEQGAPMAGVGELGLMQIAPAINSALALLIGTHLTALPMAPEDVLSAIQRKSI